MSDLFQSNMYEPTAPRENLLRRAIKKKEAKIIAVQNHKDKKQVSTSNTTSSRQSHTLVPFLAYFTQRRKINNNNNNNKFNHEHLSKVSESQEGDSQPPAPRGSTMFGLFRGKHNSDSSDNKATPEKDSSESQDQVDDTKEPCSVKPEAKGDTEVPCQGLLTKPDSLGQNCLLSQDPETDPPLAAEARKQKSNELNDLLETVGKNRGDTRSNENEISSKYEKFVDSSDLQEQMNSINLKRCKDAVMPHSISSSVSHPAHSESLSIPPVIEETEEGGADEPHVIEVFLPQREPPSQEPPNIVFVPSSRDIPTTQGRTKRRNKLRHLLRRLLTMNGSFRKEDKQWLVEEEDDEDEEEQVMAETNVDGGDGEEDQKCEASRTTSAEDDTQDTSPEKKRRPGTKVMSC